MTKPRPPASFEQAITRIAGLIGWEEVARLTGRSDRAVRDWSDPDIESLPTIAQAFALDAAYRAAGGGEAPMHSTYALRLDIATTDTHCADAIRHATAAAAKESGEAITALIVASGPNASAAERARALLEGQEAVIAINTAMTKLAVPAGTLAARTDVP